MSYDELNGTELLSRAGVFGITGEGFSQVHPKVCSVRMMEEARPASQTSRRSNIQFTRSYLIRTNMKVVFTKGRVIAECAMPV